MMSKMTKYELCNVLLKWLQSLNLRGPHKTLDGICDGVAMAQALHQIAPEWFNSIWLSKIKTDVGENWRLKVSNLKKVIEGVIDYYQEYFSRPLIDIAKPDAVKIGEHGDPAELVKLLQLIIGCAVNCNRKQEYIESIMLLEESVQNVIMECIQELEHSLGCSSLSFSASLNTDTDSQVQNLISELQTMKESNNQVTHKCLELDMQVNVLREEKAAIVYEKKKLEDQLQEILEDPMKDNVLRKQIEYLKDEIFKLETSRDDYRLKYELQEKEISDLQQKFDVLQQTAAEARHLKDEVDILRDNADKVEKLESTVQLYKKKLEEMSELKREMKLLENKNLNYIQQTMELEEELKKANAWKLQIEIYKKEISELRNNLNEETKKIDKMEFENMKAEEKLNALKQEKERIIAERDSLKEENEELLCIKLQLKGNDSSLSVNSQKSGIINEGIMSKMELKRELARLQHENNLLRQNQTDEKNPVLQLMIDDTAQQNKQLQNQCRKANQRILELEAELREVNEKNKGDIIDSRIKELQDQVTEKDRMLSEQKQYTSIMITEKEQEIQCLEERYKKSVEKARCVAKVFDMSSDADLNMLRNKLQFEKLNIMEETEKPYEGNRSLKHDTVDQKLPSVNSVGSNFTFLGKQRQSAMRRTP